MSDAFRCELCSSFSHRFERGANLGAKPKIKNKTVDVQFVARMASGVCTSDICRSCALKAFARALKALERAVEP